MLRPTDVLPPEVVRAPEGVVAVNEDGEIVAFCGAVVVCHLDPLWVRPDYRRHPALLRRLWQAVKFVLRDAGVGVAFGMAKDSQPEIGRLCKWVGGFLVDGRMYDIP